MLIFVHRHCICTLNSVAEEIIKNILYPSNLASSDTFFAGRQAKLRFNFKALVYDAIFSLQLGTQIWVKKNFRYMKVVV